MTDLYKLVYCSRNRIQGSAAEVAAELDSILKSARENNARLNVTGALLYSSGSFAQVLEGPVNAVCAVFEKIQRDMRHSEVTVLYNGPSDGRKFPDWSMGFAGSVKGDGIAGAADAFDAAFEHADGASDKILGILQRIVVQENDWILETAA